MGSIIQLFIFKPSSVSMKKPIFGGKNTTFHPKHKEKNTKKGKMLE